MNLIYIGPCPCDGECLMPEHFQVRYGLWMSKDRPDGMMGLWLGRS
jgi:hypothetical protein